jgi:hypothetical protein
MAYKTVTCVALSCNACGEYFNYDGEGSEQHYESLTEAVVAARYAEWIAHPDGFALCDQNDQAHREALAELMPPEFVPVCDGQAEIPFTEAGA